MGLGLFHYSIAKTASKKIGALICSMKFLSSEVALYLYKSTICPCMEYCCQVWAGAPSCYLELLDRLQKWLCRTDGPSLAASLETLTHHQNETSLSLFYRYYFGRCSSELVPLPFSWGRSTCYSERLHDFSVTIPRCYKYVCVNSFFPCAAILRNSLPMDCFPLTYNLNGFKSRINRHCRFFLKRFPVCYILFVLTNQGFSFLGSSFSNRDNVRASIQFLKRRSTSAS